MTLGHLPLGHLPCTRLDRFWLIRMRRRRRLRFVSHFPRVEGRGRRAGLELASLSALPQGRCGSGGRDA